MAKRKKQNSYGKKAFYIIIALIALFIIGFEAYRMVSSYIIKRASDKQWPQHDLTSGQYSGSYDGIDISRHQGRIHWDELGEVKRLKFVFVKATEGINIQDPWYESNISYARKHQIPVGSYHFLSKAPAALQFENFRAVYDEDKQDLLQALQAYYGHSPIIYCSESYFKDYLSPEFDGYYLWIASYNHEPVLPGEPHYDIWQFSRHGRVPGVWNWVDLNRFADGRTLDDIRIKE